ncbi:PepSY domain-containing protein [Methylocella tundrae]|nr:PepSY domain-containing protein [Methylocella tundrae]WPP03055.1 PepSY domain-containing protein [Methylocella tundrae]
MPATRLYIPFAVAAALVVPHSAMAVHDQDRALSALEARQILPLSEIIARAQIGDHQLLRADLEREDGRYVYELRVIARDGAIRLMRLNARTGEMLPDGKLSDAPAEPKPDEDD